MRSKPHDVSGRLYGDEPAHRRRPDRRHVAAGQPADLCVLPGAARRCASLPHHQLSHTRVHPAPTHRLDSPHRCVQRPKIIINVNERVYYLILYCTTTYYCVLVHWRCMYVWYVLLNFTYLLIMKKITNVKNGCTDREVICGQTRVIPRNHVLDPSRFPLHGIAHFWVGIVNYVGLHST